MDTVQHSDSRRVVRCLPVECQQDYEKVTVMHEAEELSTSSASEHGQETKGTRVKIPGVNIPEYAESIISEKPWPKGSSNQVLVERAKQSSLGQEGQVIKSWWREPSNQVLTERVEQQKVLNMRVEQWRLDRRVKHASESY